FDRAFLSLPEEVLVTVMRDHQKYFAVEDASGKLAAHFLAVLNTDGDRDGVIRHGNERVLRARFNDAQFFWQTDQKIPLTDRVEMLRNVMFQKDLGTYWTKTERVRAISTALARELEQAGVRVSSRVSIAGMFALGLQPSGSKDPFALRRQANGMIRILAEHNLPLRIGEIVERALTQYRACEDLKSKLREIEKAPEALAAFFRERLEFYLRDVRGIAYDVVNAVLAAGSEDVVDASARAEAVTAVRPTEDFVAISTAFKRIKNILRQAREGGKKWPEEFSNSQLSESAEQVLGARVVETRAKVESLHKQKQHQQALTHIAQLRPVIDVFFDKVMVMVDDEKLRSNRLALLATMQRSFSTIADFSEIVTER
ncbi:MAG: glycine--tRNA ligase subunit beta, partial [Acidobacteria bacterium]